jgi:hypothetical protein
MSLGFIISYFLAIENTFDKVPVIRSAVKSRYPHPRRHMMSRGISIRSNVNLQTRSKQARLELGKKEIFKLK